MEVNAGSVGGLDGARVVITGGAGGIGRACIDAFTARGASVVVIDSSREALDRLAGHRSAARLQPVVSDLATPDACARSLAGVEGPVHALVHLAGLFEHNGLEAADRSIWDRALAVNLTSAYDMVAAVVPRFDPDRTGRIVFATSVAYRRGSFDHLGYSAAKGGIAGLVRALARRLAPAVLVNAVAPGIIETPMARSNIEQRGDRLMAEIPLRRWGRADEVASVIRFLCSEDASYVTGQIINVDGGMVNS